MIGRTSIEPILAPGMRAAIAERRVEILGLDQIIAAKLLAGLRERTVRGQRLAIANPHGGRRVVGCSRRRP